MFIVNVTSRTKSKSIAYLSSESAHIYWMLDLEGGVNSIWDLWTNCLQECNGNDFLKSSGGMQQFLIKFQKSQFFYEGLPRVHPPPLKARGGGGSEISSKTSPTFGGFNFLSFAGTTSITGWGPSVSKSNRSHVGIFRFSFPNLRCIL